jgi:hypothetical protein
MKGGRRLLSNKRSKMKRSTVKRTKVKRSTVKRSKMKRSKMKRSTVKRTKVKNPVRSLRRRKIIVGGGPRREDLPAEKSEDEQKLYDILDKLPAGEQKQGYMMDLIDIEDDYTDNQNATDKESRINELLTKVQNEAPAAPAEAERVKAEEEAAAAAAVEAEEERVKAEEAEEAAAAAAAAGDDILRPTAGDDILSPAASDEMDTQSVPNTRLQVEWGWAETGSSMGSLGKGLMQRSITRGFGSTSTKSIPETIKVLLKASTQSGAVRLWFKDNGVDILHLNGKQGGGGLIFSIDRAVKVLKAWSNGKDLLLDIIQKELKEQYIDAGLPLPVEVQKYYNKRDKMQEYQAKALMAANKKAVEMDEIATREAATARHWHQHTFKLDKILEKKEEQVRALKEEVSALQEKVNEVIEGTARETYDIVQNERKKLMVSQRQVDRLGRQVKNLGGRREQWRRRNEEIEARLNGQIKEMKAQHTKEVNDALAGRWVRGNPDRLGGGGQ